MQSAYVLFWTEKIIRGFRCLLHKANYRHIPAVGDLQKLFHWAANLEKAHTVRKLNKTVPTLS